MGKFLIYLIITFALIIAFSVALILSFKWASTVDVTGVSAKDLWNAISSVSMMNVILIIAILGTVYYILGVATRPSPSGENSPWKNLLAVLVIGGSFIILAILVLISLNGTSFPVVKENVAQEIGGKAVFAFSADFAAHTIQLIGLVLPVLGTWVGTVLAFYFARENLQAAQSAFVSGSSQPKRTAAQAMTEISLILTFNSETALKQPISAIEDEIKNHRLERGVFLNEKGHVEFILHENTITRFVSHYSGQEQSLKDRSANLSELLKQEDKTGGTIDNLVRTFDAVSREDSLEICRALFKSRPLLKNLVVTESGARTDKALGLITPDILGEQ